jgi:hypothetical protein
MGLVGAIDYKLKHDRPEKNSVSSGQKLAHVPASNHIYPPIFARAAYQ